MAIVAQRHPLPPKPWAFSSSGSAPFLSLLPSPAVPFLLPAPGLPSAPLNSTHPWIWAQVTVPTFPNPMPCPGHSEWKMQGDGVGGMEANFPGPQRRAI